MLWDGHGASRLCKPPITISASETFSIETQNKRQIAPLSGRISWCILGCTTWWQRGGRFLWNIKNVGWCRIWSWSHTATLRCRFRTFIWWLSGQLANTYFFSGWLSCHFHVLWHLRLEYNRFHCCKHQVAVFLDSRLSTALFWQTTENGSALTHMPRHVLTAPALNLPTKRWEFAETHQTLSFPRELYLRLLQVPRSVGRLINVAISVVWCPKCSTHEAHSVGRVF